MQTLKGIPVSPGVAIGEALILGAEGFRIPHRFVVRDAIDSESDRLRAAVAAVAAELSKSRDTISGQLGDHYGAIFSAHLQMLHDEKMQAELARLITENQYSPEYAVSLTLSRYAKAFRQLKNKAMAERASDILDIKNSLLRHLTGSPRLGLTDISSPVVVMAHNLTPSETATLNPEFVLGFVTEQGGAGGHTAIVAEALEIPAVVGIGRFLHDVSLGEKVIIDGDHGRLILEPDEATQQRYQQEGEKHRTFTKQLSTLRELPCETADGVRIHLAANIEFPLEVKACMDRGADGIGLYRTEFLYLASQTDPTEEDHYQAYVGVARQMGERPVVIRTLDLGADKLGRVVPANEERNPFLGLRSIRISLRNEKLFRKQLRAILRASAEGNIKVMFPLISTLRELRAAKRLLHTVMDELEAEGVTINRNIDVGMMVETPSAVIMLDRFAAEVDFLSIGTNDLIQYALAVDRTNTLVADLYNAGDPSVLRLIAQSLAVAKQANIPVALCGQMSSSASYALLLLGLGLRRFSVVPGAVPEIKKICRSVTLSHCEAIAQQALQMETAEEINHFLRQEVRKLVPELAVELDAVELD
jgi:phosphoenolpyruvate-protein phosphotransferase (PTS system enzyme I)